MFISNLFSSLAVNNTQNIKVKPSSEISSINQHTSAYNLDLSPEALEYLNTTEEEPVAIYNSDALTYTKDLKIITKRR